MSRPNLLFIVGLALYTLSMRLMPYALSHFGVKLEMPETFYPWNFSPMSAFCLFGAAYYARKLGAYLLPVAILFAGDLGIWLLSGRDDWSLQENLTTMMTVYAGFLLVVMMGFWLRRKISLPKVWAIGILGEVAFFLLTNFAVWLFFGTYSKTASGLVDCYIMGLPFLGKSVASTLVFSTLIFSPYILRERKALEVAKESTSAVT